MSWLPRRKLLALLLALIGLVAVYPMLHGVFAARLLFDAVYTVVFLAALVAIFTEKKQRLPALLLGIPTLLGAWVGYALPGLPRPPVVGGFHLLAALFFAFAVAAVLRSVYREPTVSVDGICGAFCGYLLLGVAFAHLYSFMETIGPGAFRGDEHFAAHFQDEHQRYFLLTYLSLITLTTVGYGDITPASGAARGFVAVEAISGQFYIAVLVAELIGKRVAQAITGNGSRDPRDAPDNVEA